LTALLLDGLADLERETPAHLSRLCRLLDGRTVSVILDESPLHLAFGQGCWWRVDGGRASVQVVVTQGCIADLLERRKTLVEAVFDGSLGIRGPVSELERGWMALRTFLNGAARAPSFSALRARFDALEGS